MIAFFQKHGEKASAASGCLLGVGEGFKVIWQPPLKGVQRGSSRSGPQYAMPDMISIWLLVLKMFHHCLDRMLSTWSSNPNLYSIPALFLLRLTGNFQLFSPFTFHFILICLYFWNKMQPRLPFPTPSLFGCPQL